MFWNRGSLPAYDRQIQVVHLAVGIDRATHNIPYLCLNTSVITSHIGSHVVTLSVHLLDNYTVLPQVLYKLICQSLALSKSNELLPYSAFVLIIKTKTECHLFYCGNICSLVGYKQKHGAELQACMIYSLIMSPHIPIILFWMFGERYVVV